MTSVIGFLIMLGPLVIIHEFGHYLFAKLFNVKAEAFSVGFGPKLIAKKWGETEWKISAIPLGGYVKLLGEDGETPLSPEDQKRALQKQEPYKRFFIFLGGPLFNFLFAIVLFMAILAIGEPQVANVVGRVVNGSVAEKAGFQSGDVVQSVNGKPVRRFDEITTMISENPNREMDFQVEHVGGRVAALKVTPTTNSGFSSYGEVVDVGEISGLVPNPRAMTIGVSNPFSLAGKAGLKTGDVITKINEQPVAQWESFEREFARLEPGMNVRFSIKPVKGDEFEREFKVAAKDGLAAFGIYSSELFISQVLKDSPAEKAGIRSGDRIVSIGGTEIKSFYDLKEAVQKSGESRSGIVNVTWEREGKLTQVDIRPMSTESRDPVLNKTVHYTIGIVPLLNLAEPNVIVDRVLNPFTLLYRGTERMISFTGKNFTSIWKMIRQDVSVSTLGGPILIGKIAGESLSRGLIVFLTTMAVLSIGLGVLNILPIPVLDGGHLMLLGIEIVRGKPLSLRQMEVVQQVGLSLILILMVVVIKNDITRLAYFN